MSIPLASSTTFGALLRALPTTMWYHQQQQHHHQYHHHYQAHTLLAPPRALWSQEVPASMSVLQLYACCPQHDSCLQNANHWSVAPTVTQLSHTTLTPSPLSQVLRPNVSATTRTAIVWAAQRLVGDKYAAERYALTPPTFVCWSCRHAHNTLLLLLLLQCSGTHGSPHCRQSLGTAPHGYANGTARK